MQNNLALLSEAPMKEPSGPFETIFHFHISQSIHMSDEFEFVINDVLPEIPKLSLEETLDALKKTNKGFPKDYTTEETLVGPHAIKQFWSLKGPKLYQKGPIHRETTLGAIYWIPKEYVLKDTSQKVTKNVAFKVFAEDLLLRPVTLPGQFVKPIKAFYEHSGHPELIGLPRFLGLSLFGLPTHDIRTRGHTMSSQPAISLRPIQQLAVKQTLESLEAYGGASFIADCGFGKTRVAVATASQLCRKTLILCNREVLMHQWLDVLTELAPSWTVSWLQGSDSLVKQQIRVRTTESGPQYCKGPMQPADVCLGSIETLVEAPYDSSLKEFINTFGLVIVDEAHHLAAATLVHALPRCPARYVLCLSATPDRRDGLEHVLYWLGGPTSFVYKRLPSITGLTGSVIVKKIVAGAPCKMRELMYPNGMLAFANMLQELVTDEVRNKIILDQIEDHLDRAKLIVVSALVDHCNVLYESVKELWPELPLARMAGPNVETALAKNISTKIVFATFAMLEEGYDDPSLDTLILCTPRSRIQQTVGRIERQHDGKLVPVVVDIVDPFSIYLNQFEKRQHFYKSRGFTIETDL